MTSKEILRRLGAGESLTAVREAAGLSPEAFEAWWQAEAQARVPPLTAPRSVGGRSSLRIERDRWGIPHITADSAEDLFFGFGYAQAQDRLFQLDLLRRRGAGRLSEILGPEESRCDLLTRTVGFRNIFELDLLARTVGLRRIAEAEWQQLPGGTRMVLTAFADGISAHLAETQDRLPIEFDLLDYRPEPWSPLDCLTIEVEFRWYLTGRFPVIVIPELVKRGLGSGPLYQAFLQAEVDEESILPPGSYPSAPGEAERVGNTIGDPQAEQGSNNWVLAGSRTQSGWPIVASDPHIAFDAVSCWYEVHLHGGGLDVLGMGYTGIPAVMFGRTARVAWGCTNNICSQRDLYQEKTDPAHPNHVLYAGQWEPLRTCEESIPIKGGAPVRRIIRFSRNGPLVDDILPPAARGTGPVSLRWLGAERGGWLTALLGMNQAQSAAELREAMRPWYVPTFNVVYADVDGHIGFQSAGRIPIRAHWERGYRPGWDPAHQWQGLVPFTDMPHLINPERGWLATANNRVAPPDFPYALSGSWSDGLRARRIRQRIEAAQRLSRAECIAVQQDALALRAVHTLPALIRLFATHPDDRARTLAKHLEAWDCHLEPDRIAAAAYEVFFLFWAREVVAERFDDDLAALLSGGANGLSADLLPEDRVGWFAPGKRQEALNRAVSAALDYLSQRLGPDLAEWQWGKLHLVAFRHMLSGRGELGRLLDQGGMPVKGDATTVCNTGLGSSFEARSGAGYRLIAELDPGAPGLWAVDGQGQSGHPGSPHYGDQLAGWLDGTYHFLPFNN
jgi:penicillin amidase